MGERELAPVRNSSLEVWVGKLLYCCKRERERFGEDVGKEVQVENLKGKVPVNFEIVAWKSHRNFCNT